MFLRKLGSLKKQVFLLTKTSNRGRFYFLLALQIEFWYNAKIEKTKIRYGLLRGLVMTEYYLIESYDSNNEQVVDIEPEATEKDAMLKAIEQLGWIFCAREDE